jgi:hypothetical protein
MMNSRRNKELVATETWITYLEEIPEVIERDSRSRNFVAEEEKEDNCLKSRTDFFSRIHE